MRAWLGEPEQFADPKFDTIAARYAAIREINALIADLFATQTMDELVTAGQSRECRSPRCSARRRRWRRALPVGRRADRGDDRAAASTSRCPQARSSSTAATSGSPRPPRRSSARRSRLERAAIRRARRATATHREAAVRRAADSGSRRHRRGRRTRAAVRRPRRRGHQDRERGVSGRAASDAARPGDEQIVGVDPPQRVRTRS